MEVWNFKWWIDRWMEVWNFKWWIDRWMEVWNFNGGLIGGWRYGTMVSNALARFYMELGSE